MIQKEALNELGLYDVYGAWHIPFWKTNIFYGLSGIVLLGISGLFLYWIYKKYLYARPKKTCWEIALEQIDYLQKNNYANKDRGKEFYSALTATLKRYVHERYGFDSRAKTDSEFLQYMVEQKFDTHLMQEITTIFEGSLTIKFANAGAVQKQIDHDVSAAISFIKKTIPNRVE
jgi:hypothetical protein